MKDNNGRKGLVLGIIILFVWIAIAPGITAVDNDTEDGYKSIYNSEIGISDDYEEIITWIIGNMYVNFNWIKRRGFIRGEVEIEVKPWNGILFLFGLRKVNGSVEIYSDGHVYRIHAYRFIGYEINGIWGIAFGNIEWV
ncbi:MAG: hypothetical protein JSW06_09235 [Thermoplasmatales archaeon]|nr:MAG: hypothetical protein JSW06_09235 [Thermoplasmatales archaeon]